MAVCPTCGNTGFDGKTGVRRHHTQAHDSPLPNRTCLNCATEFYDKNSQRKLCDECLKNKNSIDQKPVSISLPDDTNWSNLTSYQRYYYKNREEEIERSNKRKQKIREWYRNEIKPQYQCVECGEDHPATIDFHHPEGIEKGDSISTLLSNSASKQRILEEIKRCIPLCANCHRILHSDKKYNIEK